MGYPTIGIAKHSSVCRRSNVYFTLYGSHKHTWAFGKIHVQSCTSVIKEEHNRDVMQVLNLNI